MTKPIQLREADFKKEVEAFSFPSHVKQEFFDYWSEPNKSGTKMRFELEKTWHLGRRLARWANNGFSGIRGGKENKPVIQPKKGFPENDFERIDALLEKYASKPTSVPFSDFGHWYDFLKREGLMRQFKASDINELRVIYGNDNFKCRCACVQKTIEAYINTGLRFSEIQKVREKLNG